MATITWKAMRTTLTGGRSAGGTSWRPAMTPSGSWSTRSERPQGTWRPHRTSSSTKIPPRVSGAQSWVSYRPSIAASFTGWRSARKRAAESPTAIWNGVTRAATAKGMMKPRRWWRSRRPFSQPTA